MATEKFESKPDVPRGRIENWYNGFRTIVGQDQENMGKTQGVLDKEGRFYPLGDDEEFIQKGPKNEPFVRLDGGEDVPFDKWAENKN
jgi:hypothetical protein